MGTYVVITKVVREQHVRRHSDFHLLGSYFLDTSAVIKRYVYEIGSGWVTAVCQPSAEHTIIISQATLVEAVAAFCRKAREQQLSQGISEAERTELLEPFVEMHRSSTMWYESLLPFIRRLVNSVVSIDCEFTTPYS